jgi:hypothetical protein
MRVLYVLAQVLKLVDKLDSGSSVSNDVLVRVQSWALDDQSLTAKRLRLFLCLEPSRRFERIGIKKLWLSVAKQA